ncbi:MAG TPA: hypothetical protein VF217_04255 [Rhodanobacteraceae bacterium]
MKGKRAPDAIDEKKRDYNGHEQGKTHQLRLRGKLNDLFGDEEAKSNNSKRAGTTTDTPSDYREEKRVNVREGVYARDVLFEYQGDRCEDCSDNRNKDSRPKPQI